MVTPIQDLQGEHPPSPLDATRRCVFFQRYMRADLVVILFVRTEQVAKMLLAEYDDVIKASRRMDPISLSAHPFCQSDRAENGRSRMLIARRRRMKTWP
jgi:hypothetical protein